MTAANKETIFDSGTQVVSKTAAYTADVKDDTILIDTATAAAGVTVTIPAAAIAISGYSVAVTDSGDSAGTYAITIATAGAETIDGAATATITVDSGSMTLVSNGTNLFSTVATAKNIQRVVTKTAAYTATINDDVILVDTATAAAGVTVTIPTTLATTSGYNVTITDSGASAATYTITVATEGAETIDGAATATVIVNSGSITLVSDGTNLFSTASKVIDTQSVVTKIAAYTAVTGNDVILVDTATAAAGVTITIPTTLATTSGYGVTITDSGDAAGTYAITIATEGAETIDGAATATVVVDSGSVTLVSDGTNLFTTAETAKNIQRVVTKTAAYTATIDDDVILVDTATAAAGVTITVPTALATTAGYNVTVKDSTGSAGIYTVTIATAGAETVDGAATATITVAYGSMTLVSDGTNLVAPVAKNNNTKTIASKSGTYTVANKDIDVIFADTTAAFTITIPTAFIAIEGYTLTVTDALNNATAQNITIATEGAELIDTAATIAITADDGQVTVCSNGTNLFTI